jgi:hypothetical protein
LGRGRKTVTTLQKYSIVSTFYKSLSAHLFCHKQFNPLAVFREIDGLTDWHTGKITGQVITGTTLKISGLAN